VPVSDDYPPSNRSKQRYLVEWQKDDSVCTGFTQDISPTGMFVRSINIPELGHTVSLKLQLPEGQKLRVRGTVVRSYLAPAELRQFIPSGYGVRLNEAPEAYFQLLARLFSLRFRQRVSKVEN
jgi:Tfp pilus assembly protein PilZ